MSAPEPKTPNGTQIHATAHVDESAQLGEGVVIGPHTIVGPHVKIGDRTVVHGQAYLEGHTTIGAECQIFPFASVGAAPQDLKYKGEPTELVIGDRTLIRECTTLNVGTVGGGGVTRVGSDTLIMAYVHIAHDCQIGNHVVMSNNATLAGHVTIEDWVVVGGGFIAIHQFVRLGAHSFIGAGALVTRDVPPFMKVAGDGRNVYLFGLNTIGLERRGFTAEQISTLKQAYRAAFRSDRNQTEAIDHLRAEFGDSAEVKQLADFLAASDRGVTPDVSHKKRQQQAGDTE